MPAVVLRFKSSEEAREFAKVHKEQQARMFPSENDIARVYVQNNQVKTHSIFDHNPNAQYNEPSILEAGKLLNGLSPRMKAVVSALNATPNFIGIEDTNFPREITKRDVEEVRKAFLDRAEKLGYTNMEGDPVELIYQGDTGSTIKWRLANTARLAIEIYEKPL